MRLPNCWSSTSSALLSLSATSWSSIGKLTGLSLWFDKNPSPFDAAPIRPLIVIFGPFYPPASFTHTYHRRYNRLVGFQMNHSKAKLELDGMGIMSNLVPGVRDVRASLITGYAWLLLGWLVWYPPPAVDELAPYQAAIHDLASTIGPVALGIASGVIAYLLGSVSQEVTDRLTSFALGSFTAFRSARSGYYGLTSMRIPYQLRDSEKIDEVIARSREHLRVNNVSMWAVTLLHRQLDRTVAALNESMFSNEVKYGAAERLESALAVHYDRFARATQHFADEVVRETSLPSTLLVGDNDVLYGEVDRLKAEGDLRVAVAIPILALGTFLAIESAPIWLFACVGSGILFVQGLARRNESRSVISAAIEIGKVSSAAATKYEAEIDSVVSSGDKTYADIKNEFSLVTHGSR